MLKITARQPRVDGKSIHTDFMNPAILLYELELGIPATDALTRPTGRLVEMVTRAFPALAEKLAADTQ